MDKGINPASIQPELRKTTTRSSLDRAIFLSLSLIGAGIFVTFGVRKKLSLQKAVIGAGICATVAAVSTTVFATGPQKLDIKKVLEKIKSEKNLTTLDFSEINSEGMCAKEIFIKIVKNLPKDSQLKSIINCPDFELSSKDIRADSASIDYYSNGFKERTLAKNYLATACILLPKNAIIKLEDAYEFYNISEGDKLFNALTITQGKVEFRYLNLMNPTKKMLTALQGKIKVNQLCLSDKRNKIIEPITPNDILILEPEDILIGQWLDKNAIFDFNLFNESYDLAYSKYKNSRLEPHLGTSEHKGSNPSMEKQKECEEFELQFVTPDLNQKIENYKAGSFDMKNWSPTFYYTKLPTLDYYFYLKKKNAN